MRASHQSHRHVIQGCGLENMVSPCSQVYFGSSENISEVDLISFRLLSSCLPAPEEILARLILMAISVSTNY